MRKLTTATANGGSRWTVRPDGTLSGTKTPNAGRAKNSNRRSDTEGSGLPVRGIVAAQHRPEALAVGVVGRDGRLDALREPVLLHVPLVDGEPFAQRDAGLVGDGLQFAQGRPLVLG